MQGSRQANVAMPFGARGTDGINSQTPAFFPSHTWFPTITAHPALFLALLVHGRKSQKKLTCHTL